MDRKYITSIYNEEGKMKDIVLDKRIFIKVNNCIIISGCARSGTTVTGKIIHSMQNVEYSLEPPMMYCLLPLIDVLEESHWKILYEVYLYEEFLLNALAGRSINCNRKDDSSIYNCKSENDINNRLSHSFTKIETQELAKNARIAFKSPFVVPFLPRLKEYYPGSKIIITVRNAVDLFYSILSFGWFTDKSLKEQNLIWPNHIVDGFRIPFFVKNQDAEYWRKIDELHRIAYYYIRMNESAERIQEPIVIRYEDLVSDPVRTINKLMNVLNLQYGEKTMELINSVKPRKYNNRHKSIMDKLNPDVRERVLYFSQKKW